MDSDDSGIESEILTINVAGMRYQTRECVLSRFPNTLLGNHLKRYRFWNAATNEFFFDRDRESFEAILYAYQSNGEIFLRPKSVPLGNFIQELMFFEISDELMTKYWMSEGFELPEEPIVSPHKWQNWLYAFVEQPESSRAAKCFAYFSLTMIIISIFTFCIETLPQFYSRNIDREWKSPFFFIEFLVNTWFLIEFVVRFISAPDKCRFFKSCLNICDVIAIFPFFITLLFTTLSSFKNNYGEDLAILRILRLVQVFRITRHSMGLQILLETFRASFQELTLMALFLLIGLVLFSSGMYFAEYAEPNTGFTSIPGTFWFVLVTTTTVGYGDLTPKTTSGKIIGGICVMMGTFTMTFPISIIVNNFREVYRKTHRQAALNRQKAFASRAEKKCDVNCVEFMRYSRLRASCAFSTTSDD